MASHQYQPGDQVPFRFNAGIIVASYFVSLVGAITTVELLHRRKEGKGWVTWLQQLAVSVSFGLVAIWCMHWTANGAIVLGDGSKQLQLYYNPGFTALSAVLPIVFLFCGLTIVEIRQPGQRFFWPALIVVGAVAGVAIVGMHYLGNFGIRNYQLHFPPGYVVGAAAIAICASISALALFFYFKERWINSFLRRLACACLLAGAVSGMHWTASIGTTYTLVGTHNDSTGMQRNTNLIVAIVICLFSCIICFAFAFLTQRRKKQLADRAQHVVLASAIFDKEGRILVTQEGLLPCQKITKQYNQRSFNDEFNIAHPVFQWLFRVSYNWDAVADLVVTMRNHLRGVGLVKDPTRRISPGSRGGRWELDETAEDYSLSFREQFCVAALELADSLKVSLTDLGILYNGIMMTGSLASEFQPKKRKFHLANHRKSDLETGIINPTMFGRGQLLFLVRQADKQEAQKLINDGYRFAYTYHIGDIIARSMHVPQAEMLATIDRLYGYSHHSSPALTARSYLVCFALRAAVKTSNAGWEILVPADSPCQLPMVELSKEPIEAWQQKVLNRLDGLSVNQCLAYLNNTTTEATNLYQKGWMETLLDQITALAVEVPEQFFGHALFSSKPVKASSIGQSTSDAQSSFTAPAQIYAFSIIPDVHVASLKSPNKVAYIPLSFFRCSQRVYKNSPDHAILAQKIHREFGAILAHTNTLTTAAHISRKESIDKGSSFADSIHKTTSTNHPSHSKRKGRFTKFPFFLPKSSARTPKSSALRREDSSDHELVDGAVQPSDSSFVGIRPPRPAFGGIMVSSDTTVEVHAKEDLDSSALELKDMGLRTEAGQGAKEEPTYVDELYRIASTRWQRP